MPAYLVELPENRRVQGVNTLSVFAADEAGARRAAAGQFDGDAAGLWNTVATVTEVVAGAALADAGDGWTMYARIAGAAAQTAGFDPFVVEVDGLDRDLFGKGSNRAAAKHIGSVAINDGGVATYVLDDILTAAGGTVAPDGRAATFRVTSVNVGVIDGIELVDPGHYTAAPPLTANAVTGGGGTGALMDLTVAAQNSYEALMAQMVSGLLASPDIANAAVDFSEGGAGARLLTLASIADNIGDAAVTFEVRQNGTEETVLKGAITDVGIAGAVLSVAIPASPLAPARVSRFQARV